MKEKAVVNVGKEQIKLKGYVVENNGRVGTLTYYVFRQILHSLFYCLSSLKVITNEEITGIFKTQTPEIAKKLLLDR